MIGERVRQVREAHGLTQEQMAQRIGISQAVVSDIERGRDVRLTTFKRFVAAFPELRDEIDAEPAP